MSLEVVISSSNTCEGSDESSTAMEFESTVAEVIAELISIDVVAEFDWLVEGNTIKFDWLVGGNTINFSRSFADDSKDHVE